MAGLRQQVILTRAEAKALAYQFGIEDLFGPQEGSWEEKVRLKIKKRSPDLYAALEKLWFI